MIAFFPCIYFCENNQLYFTGRHHNLAKLYPREKANVIIERLNSRDYFYNLCLKLFVVCDTNNLRLIVENPYASQHYLTENFMYKPSVIDRDRTLRGDFFKKPTQYWFINCEPTKGFSYQRDKEIKTICGTKGSKEAGLCGEERSMISPDYARNFICDFILGKQQENTIPTLF